MISAAVIRACRRHGLANSRATVAIWVAMLTPVLVGAAGLGIEVSNWSVTKADAQRTADIAAIAAMITYNKTGDLQKAVVAAANLAEVNGANGSTNRTWDSSTQTLSDNQVTVQVVPGVRNSSDTAVKVTVQKTIPVLLAHVVLPQQSVTVSADGYAELISSSGGGPKVCMLGLGGGVDGTTSGNDLTFNGAVSINSPYCSIRSNDGISFVGSVSANTAGIYAGGAISKSGAVSISGPVVPNAGQIPDPYTGLSALQSALDSAQTAIGSAINVTGGNITLSPGNYSGISISGAANVTFQPGLYLVNGSVSFTGATNISGSGVSIVASGTFSTDGGTNVNLTAATTANAGNGAIPGIVLASRNTTASSFNGATSFPVTGAIYYPNGALVFAGAVAGGSCAQLVAQTITAKGSVSLSPNCSIYGLPAILSQTPTYVATLVQ